jgi:hypothetical protein
MVCELQECGTGHVEYFVVGVRGDSDGEEYVRALVDS